MSRAIVGIGPCGSCVLLPSARPLAVLGRWFPRGGELRMSRSEAPGGTPLTDNWASPVLRDRLTLTTQGFGQHEPLIRLDLHGYSLSELSYRQYVGGRPKFGITGSCTRGTGDRRGTLAGSNRPSRQLSAREAPHRNLAYCHRSRIGRRLRACKRCRHNQ